MACKSLSPEVCILCNHSCLFYNCLSGSGDSPEGGSNPLGLAICPLYVGETVIPKIVIWEEKAEVWR